MYAIVKTGGKQYRVEKGQTLLVERLPAAEGDTVTLQPMLFRSDETVFDKDGLEKVKVEAKIVAHERGPKLRVFKFKPKRGYKRRTGHRQELTRIEVTDLKLLSRRPAAKKADEPVAGETKVAAKPPAAETKIAAKPPKEEDDGS
jgi:large subunit ribosomal protein L21